MRYLRLIHYRPQLLLAFEQTIPGTRQFHLRLIELLVVACHQIAVYLFQLDDAIHTHEQYVKWMNEPRDMGRWDSFRAPTAFSHGPYIAIEQYPNGIADAVGYWAEARIFGGVVVFDRGESETEVCSEEFFLDTLSNDFGSAGMSLFTEVAGVGLERSIP